MIGLVVHLPGKCMKHGPPPGQIYFFSKHGDGNGPSVGASISFFAVPLGTPCAMPKWSNEAAVPKRKTWIDSRHDAAGGVHCAKIDLYPAETHIRRSTCQNEVATGRNWSLQCMPPVGPSRLFKLLPRMPEPQCLCSGMFELSVIRHGGIKTNIM